jgi:hypothetical protein
MAVNAAFATVAGSTYAAIHWLATLGVVRVYAVQHTVGSFGNTWSTSTSSTGRALGLTTGPNAALTNLDGLSWRVSLVCGTFWMLRLALRAANRRIGALRAFGVMVGLGFFVSAGVMHGTTDAVVAPGRRGRTNLAITALVLALVGAIGVLGTATNAASADIPGPPTGAGDRFVALPRVFSMTGSALQLLVAAGGLALATYLTVSYWRCYEDWRARANLDRRAATAS